MAKKKTAKAKAPAAAKANSVRSSDSTSSKGSNEENSTSVATTAAVEVETPAAPAIGTSTRATRSSTRLRRRESEAPTTASGESSPSMASPLSESFTAPVPKPTTTRRTRASSVRGSKSRKETQMDEEEVASLNGEVSCDQGVNGVSVEHSVEDFANAQELPWFREKTSNFGTQQGPSNPQIQNGYLEEKPTIPKANNAFEQPAEEPPLFAEESSCEIRVKEEPTTQNSVSVKEERVDSVETIQQETSSAISPGEREESETIPAVNVKTELESDPVEEQTAEAVDEAVEDASGREEITNYEEEQLPQVNGNVSGENGSRGEENTNFVSTTSLDEKPIIPKANYAILSQKVKQEPAEPEEEVACGETRPVDEVDFSKIQDDEIFCPVQMARIKVEGEVLENREEEAPDFDENGSMEVEPQENGKAKKKAAALLQTFAKQHEEHKVEAVVLAAAEPSTECPNSSETEASTESPAESPKPLEQGDENTKKEEEPKEKTTPKKDDKKTEKKSDSDRRRSRSRSRSRDRRRSRSPVRSPRRHRSRSRDRSRDRRRSRSRSYDRRSFKRSRSPGRRFGGRYSGHRGGYRGNHGRFGYRPDRRRSRSRSVDRRRRDRRSRSRSYSKSPLRSLGNSPEPNKDSKAISDASVETIRPEEIPLPPPAPPAPEVTPEMPEYEEINELLYLDDEWGKNGKKLKRNYEKSSSCFCKQQGLDCSDSSCANRAMLMECPARCVPGCKNRNFSNKNYAPIEAFYTGPNKGWGVRAKALISKGTFITEYLGEVVTVDEFQKRTVKYAKDPKHKHHYIFELGKKLIDATVKGNCSRFINHSCEPNAVCYKWAVPKTPRDVGRIGFFAKADICPGEEITFDYQFCNYGKAQQCYCGAAKCKGTIGEIADAEGGSDVEEEESDETPSDLDDEEDKSEEERRKAEIRADNAHKKVTSILQLVSIPGSKMAMKAKILVREMIFLDEETDMKRRVISYLESSSDFFKIAKRAHLFDVFASWLSSSEWEHHDMYLKTEVIRLIGKQDTVDRTSGWTIPCCEAVEAIASMEMPDFLAARDVMSALLDQVASDGEVEMDGDSPAETYEEVFNQMRQEARDLMTNTNFEEVKRCCNVTKFKIPKKQQQQPRAAAGKESRDVSIVKQRDDSSYPQESRWGPNYGMPRFGRRFNRRRYDRFVPFSSNDRNFLPQACGPQRRIFFPDFSNSGRFGNRKRGFDEADQDMNGLSAKRQLPDLLSLPARVESPVEMELASTPEDSPKHSAIPVPQITPTNITTPFGLMSTPASSSKTSETATSTGTSAPPPPSVDISAYHNWLKSYGNAAPSDGSHLFNLATTHLQTMDDKIAFYGALGDDLYNAYQDALEKELSYMKVALPKRLDAAYKRAQLVAEEEKKKLAMAAAPAPVVLTAPQIAPPPLEAPKKKKKEYMWIRARDPSDTSGEVYFFHKVTNETVWELPAGEEYDPMEPVVMFTSTGEVATAEPDSSSAVNEENRPDLASRLEEVFSEPPVSAKASSSSVGRPESRSDSRNHHHHHHVKDSAKKNLKISEEKLLKKFKAAIEAVVHPTVHALLKDVPSADESKTKWMAKLIAKEMTKRESARPDFDYVMHTANKERINHYAKKYLTRKIVDERCAELWKGYEHS